MRPFLYDAQTRHRAVTMYRERIAATGESQMKARRHVGNQLGIKQATLHSWIRTADAARTGHADTTKPGGHGMMGDRA